MMLGEVRDRKAQLPVAFILPGMPGLSIDFVVDTGFAGFLTLPLAAVEAMQLPYEYTTLANLANDQDVPVPVHRARIRWEEQDQEVRVLATGKRPLLGVSLLENAELFIQFIEGGVVRTEPVF